MLKYKKTQPISDLIDQVYPNFPLAEAIKKATIRGNLHPTITIFFEGNLSPVPR
jgi:hypothetical protein